ncbi:Translation initiation factor eIF2B subunit gamma-like protein [Drosera capensis]
MVYQDKKRNPPEQYPYSVIHCKFITTTTKMRSPLPMDFQVVVLAGGVSKNLVPLVSKDVPQALLPVANRPLISYVLELLEQSDLREIIVVVEGQDSVVRVGTWISKAFLDRLRVEVAAVPEDVGSAGAIRAIAHRLSASDILVVSGDLVCDVPPGAIASVHRRHDAAVTAMLCSTPVSAPADSGSSGGKDKVKKPSRCNVIGLDPTKQFLLHIAAGTEVEKDIRFQKSILRAVGQVEIRADLMDAHLYVFKRSVLMDLLEQKGSFQSLQQDVLPYLVRTQLRSEVLANTTSPAEENGNHKLSSQKNQVMLSQLLANASTPSFHGHHVIGSDESKHAPKRTHKCCVYIAAKSKYCARLNSIQSFSDINRDVSFLKQDLCCLDCRLFFLLHFIGLSQIDMDNIQVTGEASHLSGYSFSAQNNIIHPSAELGSKTTVGPNCILGEGSQMADKCSVKRSVIGPHCRIGSNVKIVNSVVMNHATIGDGCSIQGTVICSNAQLQERVTLKDCQVGAGFVVPAGSDYKGEPLAKKDKSQ